MEGNMCLKELRAKLLERIQSHAVPGEKGLREMVRHATLVSAASSLKSSAPDVFSEAAEQSFKQAVLSRLFTSYSPDSGGKIARPQPFDASRLTKYHHRIPFTDDGGFWWRHSSWGPNLLSWLERLCRAAGTHPLEPPPLVPASILGRTYLHALSYSLTGGVLHWHAIGMAVQKQISSSSSLSSPSSAGILGAVGKYDEAVAPGEEGVVHPALLQAAATALGRVIVLIDPSAEEGEKGGGGRGGVWLPEAKSGGEDSEAPILPPLVISVVEGAYEGGEGGKGGVVPLVPVALSDESKVHLPGSMLPMGGVVAARLGVESGFLVPGGVEGGGGVSLLGGQAAKEGTMVGQVDKMGLVFRWVTGLELQYVWDVRAMLYSMGVGEVPFSDLIIDAAEALSEGRAMYSGVSAQVSSKRGVHRLDDLEPGGRLHDEAIVMMRKGREEGRGGGGARFDDDGEGIGVVMRGVDVPTHMKPGILRLYVSMGGLPGHVWTEGQRMSLVVHNVTPAGDRRSARVGFERPSGGEERAVGAELRLMEEGNHILEINVIDEQGGSASCGEHSVDVGGGHEAEVRHLIRPGGDISVYSGDFKLAGEPFCDFKMRSVHEGLALARPLSCRCCGDSSRMRPLDPHGVPLYEDGDVTTSRSQPGSCCDRKHFWCGNELNNMPVEINLHLKCPASFHPSGNADVSVFWIEGEDGDNHPLNSNVYAVSAEIIKRFWPEEPECPWPGWEAQLNEYILRAIPDTKVWRIQGCERAKWLRGQTSHGMAVATD